MKKFIILTALGLFQLSFSQFKINVESPSNFSSNIGYLYTLDGSKDILYNKENKIGNQFQFTYPKSYVGMMKIYFPETNSTVNFVSENKDVKMTLIITNDKVTSVDFLDDANREMKEYQDNQQKKENILPALFQLKEYYSNQSDFGKALDAEINRISKPLPSLEKYPFVDFYIKNYDRFLVKSADKKQPTQDEILTFLTKTNDRLETSSLLKPVLIAYLNAGSKANVSESVDKLLNTIGVESPRGQTFLSELIEIFDTYGMDDLKEKYLKQAEGLTCTITDRLSSTISSSKNTEIGAKFPNNTFINPTNTKAKTLYDVKANKKIIMFWSSTCSHCEKQLPELLAKYQDLKKLGVEIIGLSLDTDKVSYLNRATSLPWINDSELKGWYSSYTDTYNIHATPTYFILDSENKIIAKPNVAKDVLDYFKLK